MNICIFPGTFNPIHIAHIKMAKFALQKYGFDKVIFIPAHIPPHKQVSSNLAQHRYNMVKLVCDNNSKFEISDIEYNSENTSYTLITVQKIREFYNIKGRLNFIIGTDAFSKIRTWYKVDELKNLVHFIVFPRGEDVIEPNDFKDFSYELADADKTDISSTEIRTAKKRETVKEVEEYIVKNRLYD